MKILRQGGMLLAGIALLLALAPARPALADEPGLRTIRVAAFPYSPAIFQTDSGEVQGWYVDLLDEIGRHEQLRFEYVYGSWAEGLERAKRGEVDLVTSVAFTPERDSYLDFAKVPALTVWGELFVHEKSTIDGILGIEGKSVAVMINDFNAQAFRETAQKFGISCTYVEVASFDEVFRAIETKQVDAGVVSRLVGATRPQSLHVKPAGVLFNPFDIFFAVPEGHHADLLATIDRYLTEWRKDRASIYYQSRDRWFRAGGTDLRQLPVWIVYTLAGLLATGMVALLWIILLRRKVRQSTAQLQTSEERLRLALAAAGQGLYDLNLATGEAIVNADYARMLGYDPAEFRETNAAWRERLHPDDREAVYQIFQDYVAGRRGDYRVEFRQRTKQGDWKWVLSMGRIVERDKRGAPTRMLGTHTDINAIKQVEQELYAKNTELERFLYTVSHDLRSPVVTIKGFLELLEMDLQANHAEDVERDLGYLNGAADRMSRLLEEVLEMSRVGRTFSKIEPLPFVDLVNEAVCMVGGAIAQRQVKIVIAPTTLVLHGERDRLVEVWQNLVENAVKYMGEQPEPRIDIGLEEHEKEIVFFIRDNGIGIDPQYHDKIFGLFDKLDQASDGSGLGLALVKRIVELCQGRIWVESAGEGDGSCFYFTLPSVVKQTRRDAS